MNNLDIKSLYLSWQILLIIKIMSWRRVETRTHLAESVNQKSNDRGGTGHEETDNEDPQYNKFDEKNCEEEKAEDTKMGENPGGNPKDQFMHLLWENLNRHPPHPQAAHTIAAIIFKAFKSLKPPEFRETADPVESRAWLKDMEKSFEILRVDEA